MLQKILTPLHLLGSVALSMPFMAVGYMAANQDFLESAKLSLELKLSGPGNVVNAKFLDEDRPVFPVIAEANDLFDVSGKGPRADLSYKNRYVQNMALAERRAAIAKRIALEEMEKNKQKQQLVSTLSEQNNLLKRRTQEVQKIADERLNSYKQKQLLITELSEQNMILQRRAEQVHKIAEERLAKYQQKKQIVSSLSVENDSLRRKAEQAHKQAQEQLEKYKQKAQLLSELSQQNMTLKRQAEFASDLASEEMAKHKQKQQMVSVLTAQNHALKRKLTETNSLIVAKALQPVAGQMVRPGLPIIDQKSAESYFHIPVDKQYARFSRITKEQSKPVVAQSHDPKPQFTGLEVKKVALNNNDKHKTFFGGLTENEFRQRETRCLATAIYFEARGEPVRGQLAVAQVIMNRVRSQYYTDTVCGVVYEGAHKRNSCQFSFACDGHADKPRDKERWRLAQKLSKDVTAGKVWLKEIGNASHYHATYVRPRWRRSMRRVAKIGAHIFYRSKLFPRSTRLASK